jgi:hypothetical protein
MSSCCRKAFATRSGPDRLSGYPYVARGPRKKQRDEADRPRGRGRDYKRVKYRRKGEGWGKWGSSGLWVLSNHPIDWVKSHAYRYCAGLDCLANKGVMLVSGGRGGPADPVEIADTHLNSKGASGVPRKRNRMAHHLQADELKSFMEADRTPGSPADRRRRLQRHALARPLRLRDERLSVRGGQPAAAMSPAELRHQDLRRRRRALAGHPGPDRLPQGDRVEVIPPARSRPRFDGSRPANRCCPITTATSHLPFKLPPKE